MTAARSAGAPASPAPPGFTGYDWQVVDIGHNGRVTPIPARLGVVMQFSPGGQFGAFDGINLHSGTYQATRNDFTTSGMTSTLKGQVGSDEAIELAMLAMHVLSDGTTYPVRLTGDQLAVDLGACTLTCRRAGPRAGAPGRASAR